MASDGKGLVQYDSNRNIDPVGYILCFRYQSKLWNWNQLDDFFFTSCRDYCRKNSSLCMIFCNIRNLNTSWSHKKAFYWGFFNLYNERNQGNIACLVSNFWQLYLNLIYMTGLYLCNIFNCLKKQWQFHFHLNNDAVLAIWKLIVFNLPCLIYKTSSVFLHYVEYLLSHNWCRPFHYSSIKIFCI